MDDLEVQRTAAQVTALADAYVAEVLARFPERAELQGFSVERHDTLTDNSLAALADWHALEDGWAKTLETIDPATLRGRPEWVTYGFVREAIEASRQARVCRNELWPVNHLGGWQADLPLLIESQPVGSDRARDEAIRRWSALPRYLETEVDNLRAGMALGYSTPRRAVELVMEQLDALLGMPIERWPFFDPATRDGLPTFIATWRDLLADRIGPAIVRYRDFLRNDYLARARTELSITAHPDGEASYQAAFRAATTIERPGAETYVLAVRRVEQNLEDALDIGRRELGTTDLRSLVRRSSGDPANRFETREAKLAFARAAVTRARERAPAFFSRLPTSDVEVEPYPVHLDTIIDDSYLPPAEDGSRPARYLISLVNVDASTRSNAEITVFHEAYPGHHLQVGLANEQPGAHQITRLLYNSGFVEGWARYAESLAEEMGLYSSAYALADRRLWPARGMATDPAIHLLGWSRERAVAFMAESGRMTTDEADATVDRIAVWPGQFAAYDTGGLEFLALRAEAERALGADFDIREFHEVVLRNGAVTLPMLREQVDAWLSVERGVGTP